MEAIGSEVGLKMRSAIKAKLMELGCYVDDELPDYVMVMVANKRTRSQMEEDLQLFLSTNTEAFVGWLHQVLQKLQEVTINTKLVNHLDSKKNKSKHSDNSTVTKKEHKEKDKKKNKDKNRTKEKLKSKAKKYKREKSKKTGSADSTKDSERIRPNVPRLLMNLEKESSPSITDVFAGQILKSHGITSIQNISSNLDRIEGNNVDISKRKPIKNRFPIIDPATVSQINTEISQTVNKNQVDSFDIPSITEIEKLKSPQTNIIKTDDESNPKKKVTATCSDSDDEDVINIRTEAEELLDMGINEDISMNYSKKNDALTPPLIKSVSNKSNRELITAPEPDFPQIELNLPKRPLRERLGTKNDYMNNKRAINTVNPYQPSKQNRNNSSDHDDDNFTNRISSTVHFDKHESKNSSISFRGKVPIKQRLSMREKVSDKNIPKKKIGSRVVSLPNEPPKNNISVAVASVVRAPPRPQNQGISAAPQLLLRAMADAHKSLLNMPPKVETGTPPKKKALVFPMRRNAVPQKIIIEVPSNNIPLSKHFENQDSNSDFEIDMDIESLDLDDHRPIKSTDEDYSSEYVPEPLGNTIDKPKTLDYIPTHIDSVERKKGVGVDDISTISKVLNPSNDSPKDNSLKDPQFVVTLDGLDPNVFLAKKLQMIHEDSETEDHNKSLHAPDSTEKNLKCDNVTVSDNAKDSGKIGAKKNIIVTFNETNNTKNISNVTISNDDLDTVKSKLKIDESSQNTESTIEKHIVQPQAQNSIISKTLQRKRKASPIVFNDNDTVISKVVIKNDGSKEDRSIVGNKYDSLPSLPPDRQKTTSLNSGNKEMRCKFFPDCKLGETCEFYHPSLSATPIVKQNSFCRAFPACTFGSKCAYIHPPCKFNTTCVRKDCPFSHEVFKPKVSTQNSLVLPPVVASRVVPGMNYKSISPGTLPAICKFYPNCINPECHWYHPKPCRFGKHCVNKTECNFYHYDVPSLKWRNAQ